MVAADASSRACSAHTITAIPTSHSVSSSNGGDFGTGLRRDRRRLRYAAGAMTHIRCDCASDVAAAGAEQVRAPPVTVRSVSAENGQRRASRTRWRGWQFRRPRLSCRAGQVDKKPLEPGRSKLRSCSRRGAGSVEFASQFGDGYAAHGPGGNIQAGSARDSGVHDGARSS